MENKCEIMRPKIVGDKWGVKSCDPEHSKHPECKWETNARSCWQRISLEKGETSGDRRDTSVKSCEAEHCDHPEHSGRQLWEASGKSCGPKQSENPGSLLQENMPGDKRQIMRPNHTPLSKEQEPLTGKPVCGKTRKNTKNAFTELSTGVQNTPPEKHFFWF